MKQSGSFQKILGVFFAFICILIAVRCLLWGERRFIFLVWNLFLAWLPFVISKQFNTMHRQAVWKQGILFFTWLIFWPYALYVVTDLVHLNSHSAVPKWYDALLLFSAAVLSLLMGFISLLRAEVFLQRRFGNRVVRLLLPVILVLGSFGVYLGRFLRWNSWDVVSNPLQLCIAVARRFVFPVRYLHTWTITLLFAILFYLLYQVLKKMPGYLRQAT